MKTTYGIGRLLAVGIWFTAIIIGTLLLVKATVVPRSGPAGESLQALLRAELPVLCVLLLVLPVTRLVGLAGQVLACLAADVKIRAVHLGTAAPQRSHFSFGKLVLTPAGLYRGGQVIYEPRSAGSTASIWAANPLANLVVAGSLLAAFSPHDQFTTGIAVYIAGMALSQLLPYRSAQGAVSVGARLLALAGGPFAEAIRQGDANGWLSIVDAPPAMKAEYRELERDYAAKVSQPERTTRWLRYYYDKEMLAWLAAGYIGQALRQEGRIDELVALHEDLPLPVGPLAQVLTVSAAQLSAHLLLIPGVPAAAVERAMTRTQWTIDNVTFKPEKAEYGRAALMHNLAVGKYRLGQFADVEELCRAPLACQDLEPGNRATILATIVLARKALGQPYEDLLTEAIALDPTADLVAEASAAPAHSG